MKVESTGLDRTDLLTITMTREEWDGAIHSGYSYVPIEDALRAELLAEVDQGGDARLAAARAEFEAALPRLDDETKKAVRAEVARLVAEHRAGRLDVDHLGVPFSTVGEFSVSVVPAVSTGGSGLHFATARQHWFAGKQYPMDEDDRMWFVRMAGEETGQNPEAVTYWNEAPAPWVSVRWTP